MSDSEIRIVRWVLLTIAIFSMLQATVFYDAFRRLILERWFAANERLGTTVPAQMRSSKLHRVWLLLTAVIFAALWWYFGTPRGEAWLRAP